MCSSGGPMADVDLGKLKSKKYIKNTNAMTAEINSKE